LEGGHAMQIKNIIKQTVRNHSKLIVGLVFVVLFTVTLKVVSIVLLRKMIDDMLQIQSLAIWVSLFFVAIAMFFVMDSIRVAKGNQLSNTISRALRYSIFRTVMRSELAELEKQDAEVVVQTLDQGCDEIANVYVHKNIIRFGYNCAMMLAILIAGVIIHPILTMIFLTSLPFYYGIHKGIEKLSSKSDQKRQSIEEHGKIQMREAFHQLRHIKLKNAIVQKEEDYENWLDQYASSENRNENIHHIFKDSMPNLLIGLIIMTFLGLGGFMLRAQMDTTIGDIVAFTLFAPVLYTAFKNTMGVTLSTNSIEEAVIQLEKIISIRSELKSEPVQSLEDVHSLKFHEVTFKGTSIENSVDNITFEVKRGETFGVLAVEGNSPSVLFDLITKITRPKSGSITINNCDINKLDTFYLRDIVTAVPRKGAIFEDSIQKNIIYPFEFDEYQYNDALNRSGLKEFLYTLERKDQTIISEKTDWLTQDQKQRIVLASAFYKDSKIFVLNEATDLLNPRSEDELLKEVFKLKNKIIMIFSSRVYNLLNCDKLLVIENNAVVEYGKTSDLLQDRNSMLSRQIKRGKITRTTKVS
jgi:ABC-type multidrug transport system fused ATPase/permease subunit